MCVGFVRFEVERSPKFQMKELPFTEVLVKEMGLHKVCVKLILPFGVQVPGPMPLQLSSYTTNTFEAAVHPLEASVTVTE